MAPIVALKTTLSFRLRQPPEDPTVILGTPGPSCIRTLAQPDWSLPNSVNDMATLDAT